MGKIFLGLFGSYRTFEKTSELLFTNLIDNNKNHEFEIYINTECDQGYLNKKWENHSNNYNKYNKNELDLLFKKHYKKNLKNVTYVTKFDSSPISTRVRYLIFDNIVNKSDNIIVNEFDLYIFLRLDVCFIDKINIDKYLFDDSIYLINRNLEFDMKSDICPNGRMDHNRDSDMGIISKNIKNIIIFTGGFKLLNPELDDIVKSCISIGIVLFFKNYDSLKPSDKIYEQYISHSSYYFHNRLYSYCKQFAPIKMFDIYVDIIR